MIPLRRHHHRGPRFAVRSADLGRRLDTFLVCAVASVIGNRVFLILTGYPQIGNSTLHISHAIWGALMMAIAVILAVTFLGPFTRNVVAVLGGVGFGFFIDELGKFITRDVDYFFHPTFALIYSVFLIMFLAFRAIERGNFGPDEGLLNALEALKAAALGQLDEPARREALALLETTGASGPLATQVHELLDNVPTFAPGEPGRLARTAEDVRRRYLAWTQWPSFPGTVDAVFTAFAAAAIGNAVVLALDGPGIRTFPEWATVSSSLASGLFIVVGVVLLHRRGRYPAYRWFDRALLVEIYVTQIFLFDEEQLAAVIRLGIALFVWAMLRSAMRAEREHDALESARPAVMLS